MMTGPLPVIAILGGTGALGSGLARRWAAAGYPVVLGSRSADKACAAAQEIEGARGAPPVRGENTLGAVRAASIVVIAVPFANHETTLDEIREAVAGKIVIDTVVPLVPPKVSLVQPPPGGSAGELAQARLGPQVRVVSAFHNVAAAKLSAGGDIDCDVLVFGDNREARDVVIGLADAIGTRGLDGGPIANSIAAEALTSVLIGINRRYKAGNAGLRITGTLVR